MKKFLMVLILISFSVFALKPTQDFKSIDDLFVEWNNTDVPGAAIGIVKDGELIYSNGYGSADLEHDINITPTSVFYIGSVSKQFVTFSILLLEEQGKLDLDDNIQKYLPDFPDYGKPLTIRHFIHHTSGVRDYLTLMYLKGRNYLDNADVDEVYELIKNQKELNFTPGEKYLYSNSCYFMLAMIVEKAAGESLKVFADKNIFKPLGMKSSLFYDDNTDLIKNRVFSYRKKSGEEGFDNLISRFDLVGSGGVYSSVEDLYLWDQNFYNNKLGKGGQGIIEKMHEEGLLNNGESSGYAFALTNGTYKGLKTVSHGGALAGYRSQLIRFPEEKFSVIVLANRGDANPTSKAHQIADIFLKDKLVEEQIQKKDSVNSNATMPLKEYTLKQLTGSYEVEPGVVLEVSIKNGVLHVIQSWNKSDYYIGKIKGNTYQIPGDTSIQFTFSDLKDNSTQTLTVFQNGSDNIWKRKEAADTSSLNLEDYLGQYYSEELDINYTITITEEKLMVNFPNSDAQELIIYDKDTFTTEGGLVRFNRSANKIIGFELDAGRVTNLKFLKK